MRFWGKVGLLVLAYMASVYAAIVVGLQFGTQFLAFLLVGPSFFFVYTRISGLEALRVGAAINVVVAVLVTVFLRKRTAAQSSPLGL